MLSIAAALATLLYVYIYNHRTSATPHTQGSLQATQDQIAGAHLSQYRCQCNLDTPLSGRYGLRRVPLTVSAAGFTVASMLCGQADSLGQMVVFRGLQGHLRRTVSCPRWCCEAFPKEAHGRATGFGAWA